MDCHDVVLTSFFFSECKCHRLCKIQAAKYACPPWENKQYLCLLTMGEQTIRVFVNASTGIVEHV